MKHIIAAEFDEEMSEDSSTINVDSYTDHIFIMQMDQNGSKAVEPNAEFESTICLTRKQALELRNILNNVL